MNKHIRRIARIDVPGLARAFVTQRKLLGRLSFREDMEGGPHGHTRSIFLRWARNCDAEGILQSFDNVDYPASNVQEFATALRAIERELATPVERALIIRLEPGGCIGEHIDQGHYADHTERFHLPIITTPFAWLKSGDEVVNMRRGVLYYFDKHVPHSGANEGPYERVHLVVDIGC
jgi:hypothetical protein